MLIIDENRFTPFCSFFFALSQKVNKKEKSLNLLPFEKAHLSARGITLILQRKHKK
jgi:hypothetical protein